jgi:hypothetical protein
MVFLIVLFTVALSLCVVGLAIVSLWWSWLFAAAVFESVRGYHNLDRDFDPGTFR